MKVFIVFLAVAVATLGFMASQLHQDCPHGSVSISGVAMCRSGR